MQQFGIGHPMRRAEDARLLAGGGRYTEDLDFPGCVHAALLRSPHAHAHLLSVDTTAARATPDVLLVLTGEDYAAAGLGNFRCVVPRTRRDGTPMIVPPFPALVTDRVRFVGQPVAVALAETRAQAETAIDHIAVEYAPLSAVVSTADALGAAVAVWDECPDNECFFEELGDRAAVDAAFDAADHVVRHRLPISRVTGNPLEVRSCVAGYDPHSGRLSIYTPTQVPHTIRHQLAEAVFRIPEIRVRVVSGDVGGAFGMRAMVYPEIALTAWAAQRLHRPVKWVATRAEGVMTDLHARDNVTDAELALDSDGRILALRVRTVANLGAYLSHVGTLPPVLNLGTLAGVYTTPAIHVQVSGVFTHTAPTGPYRGAGRPEAAYVLERTIDSAARAIGIDRIDIRRRNMIPAAALPYKTALTYTYDCGAFERNMDKALEQAGVPGFTGRRAAAAERGRLRGLGIANVIGQAASMGAETAELRFDPSGSATIVIGTHNHGQGHETIFRQILVSTLGLDAGSIEVLQGDTDVVPFGTGTWGSRSVPLGGAALVSAAEKVIDKARRIAAHMLEAAEADVRFADGTFSVTGTDRVVSLVDVARAAFDTFRLPRDIEPGLHEIASFSANASTFPNGCHICEVEVDPDTGAVEVVGYTVVDDVGTVINPLLLEGQIHGGVAQGLGQALMERIVYDPRTGQLLSASFLDYCMPRADDVPNISTLSQGIPTTVNPLGAKGGGEAGPMGALPAVMNAVADALSPLGIDHIDMPATPESVWRALRSGPKTGGRGP